LLSLLLCLLSPHNTDMFLALRRNLHPTATIATRNLKRHAMSLLSHVLLLLLLVMLFL
jgi:hypothetical protein